eukprot:5688943-Alexandrium_andersonii.AAC.1
MGCEERSADGPNHLALGPQGIVRQQLGCHEKPIATPLAQGRELVRRIQGSGPSRLLRGRAGRGSGGNQGCRLTPGGR